MAAGGWVATRLATRSRFLHSIMLLRVIDPSFMSTRGLVKAREFDGETELEKDMEAIGREVEREVFR